MTVFTIFYFAVVREIVFPDYRHEHCYGKVEFGFTFLKSFRILKQLQKLFRARGSRACRIYGEWGFMGIYYFIKKNTAILLVYSARIHPYILALSIHPHSSHSDERVKFNPHSSPFPIHPTCPVSWILAIPY